MKKNSWGSCSAPHKMLETLGKRADERKLRLFCCACCRRVWATLGPREREAVRVAERYADGEAKACSLRHASRPALSPAVAGVIQLPRVPDATRWRWSPPEPSHADRAWQTAFACAEAVRVERGRVAYDGEQEAQAEMLRCVFGNPFRPVPFNAAWRTPDTLALARVAYKERAMPTGTLDPTRLAILADALEEAGCADDDVLGHLRGLGTHVRGCWLVDLLSGKEQMS